MKLRLKVNLFSPILSNRKETPKVTMGLHMPLLVLLPNPGLHWQEEMPISVLQRSFILTSHVVSSPTMQVSIRTSGTTGRGRKGGRRTAGCLPPAVSGPLCGMRLPARGWSLGPGLTETPDPTCRVGGEAACRILKWVGRPSM